jgi:hypothetical protein
MTTLLGKKAINKLGSQLNDSASMGVSDFAKRAMAKMGWTEGKGLGAAEDGMTESIRVKKRVEGEGIGEEKRRLDETNDDWWRSAFDKGASNMHKDKKGKKVQLFTDSLALTYSVFYLVCTFVYECIYVCVYLCMYVCMAGDEFKQSIVQPRLPSEEDTDTIFILL